jgi:hypothetical protein
MALGAGAEFWTRLGRHINDALRASRDNNIRFLWLDGFVPNTLLRYSERAKVLAKSYVTENDGNSFVEYRACLRA